MGPSSKGVPWFVMLWGRKEEPCGPTETSLQDGREASRTGEEGPVPSGVSEAQLPVGAPGGVNQLRSMNPAAASLRGCMTAKLSKSWGRAHGINTGRKTPEVNVAITLGPLPSLPPQAPPSSRTVLLRLIY